MGAVRSSVVARDDGSVRAIREEVVGREVILSSVSNLSYISTPHYSRSRRES